MTHKIVTLLLLVIVSTGLALADVCNDNDSWCLFQWQQATPEAIAAILAEQGIDDIRQTLDIKGNTILHYVSNNPNPAVFTALLKAGADVHAYNRSGMTALHHVASGNQDSAIVMVLLNAGATINGQDYQGNTALHWAAQGNTNPVMSALLLEAGADSTIKNKQGKTAVEVAKDSVYQGNKDNIIAVLERSGEVAEKSFATAREIAGKFKKD